jgi:two-component system osmolarity sensor histidine kinase EnvZ
MSADRALDRHAPAGQSAPQDGERPGAPEAGRTPAASPARRSGLVERFLPQGLYGRAALILVTPLLVLQLVVSVVFIQRHYEGVTVQMTRNLAASLGYLHDEVNGAPDLAGAQARAAALSTPLGVVAHLPPDPGEPLPAADLRTIDDLTGRAVIATLRGRLEGVIGVDLVSAHREVLLAMETVHGPMLLRIDRRQVSASNPHQLIVIVVLTGLLMAAVAYFFLRRQLRPIRQLALAAEAFGKGRQMPYRPRGASEVRAAGEAFVAMRDRIERQIEQRTLLLSAVSHDLRTPLTRLRLALALMEEGPETEAMLRDVAEMERLADSFLAYARGAATEAPQDTDVVALAEAAVERARRVGTEVDLRPTEGRNRPVRLRPELLARVLDNLIGNAARHARRCAVSVAVDGEAVRITVEDDGPGIPTERRAEAVQPFARLDDARNQDRPGAGLGLAIVADAVRSHGGRLDFGESARLGGLKVEILLPV